jgi:hypothetical protein
MEDNVAQKVPNINRLVQYPTVFTRIPPSEMIFKMKNTLQKLISAYVQHFFHEPCFIKLVP